MANCVRLFFTTEDFKIEGLSYPGIPFLLDDRLKLVDPANAFLIHVAVHRGGSESPKTWSTYGWHLYDYFSFLEANELNWNENLEVGSPTVVAIYRNWAAKRNVAKTVNQRLGTIIRFYRFAHARGWISTLPWDGEAKVVHGRSGGFLAHVSSGGRHANTPDVTLRDRPSVIELLTRAQIRDLLTFLKPNPTHLLMVKLALATGLRREEILSFPRSYIFNPDTRLDDRVSIKVTLNPTDMEIKGNRPRSIFMTRSLMRELWDYAVVVRSQYQARCQRSGREADPSIFIADKGGSYSPTMLNKVLSRASEKLGFYVHPHMLRHSFATHELHAMRESTGRTDMALLWVKERLGHSSIKTTEVYLHLLAELEHEYLAAYQYDLDQLTQDESFV
ncbi:tyrosine-type recombinase/integrase [Pseudomonas profundi]|uniref:tyrosine-type recombinase/integrase n=1 Tax=Pseudomonas profundi TaxID=1981513 RepID=UPI00123AD926|nr:site-specific integrase [Pseudomonas profundi]